jgi:hypothetical protein
MAANCNNSTIARIAHGRKSRYLMREIFPFRLSRIAHGTSSRRFAPFHSGVFDSLPAAAVGAGTNDIRVLGQRRHRQDIDLSRRESAPPGGPG